MSTEAPIGLTIMEKLIGLVIILIGFITFYVTATNTTTLGSSPMLFLAAGLVLMVLGLFILIAKAE